MEDNPREYVEKHTEHGWGRGRGIVKEEHCFIEEHDDGEGGTHGQEGAGNNRETSTNQGSRGRDGSTNESLKQRTRQKAEIWDASASMARVTTGVKRSLKAGSLLGRSGKGREGGGGFVERR